MKKNWSQIKCAAFCELLFEKNYLINHKYRIKDCNAFAKARYGWDIKVQLNATNKKDRETHKKILKSLF